MEMKQITNSFSLILSVLFFVISIPASSATALRYHTLVFNPQSQQLESPSRPVQHNPSTEADDPNSLTLELIHRDQLIPPAASNINTREALLLSRLERDRLRVEAISNHAATTTTTQSESISGPLSSGLTFGTMEYFVRLGVGTPAKQLYLALDTVSDLVWLQCLPCKSCYNQADPIFDPTKSTSFAPLYCDTPLCKQLVHTYYEYSNCKYSKSCLYSASYGDDSYTTGKFSTETLTFGKTRVKKVAFGCGYNNSGGQEGYAGILGLGRGSLSFPSQTSHKKFSYCLASLFSTTNSSKSSSITFGESAVPKKAKFTPVLNNSNTNLNTLYYVGLKGISVGGKHVKGIKPSYLKMDSNGNGGVIVDSGTAYTLLNQNAYKPLREAFVKAMKFTVMATNPAPFDTCYNLSGLKEVTVPTVVLHFDGVDMHLPDENYIVMMDYKGTYCFAFVGLGQKGGVSIIGNMIQQGFRVSYHLDKNRIGFTSNACPRPRG